MVKVTATEVNNLRKKTGAGMMDCKNALVEAEGDIDKAIEILRNSLLSVIIDSNLSFGNTEFFGLDAKLISTFHRSPVRKRILLR